MRGQRPLTKIRSNPTSDLSFRRKPCVDSSWPARHTGLASQYVNAERQFQVLHKAEVGQLFTPETRVRINLIISRSFYLDTRILSESYKNPIRIHNVEKSISSNAYTLLMRNCKGQALNEACLWACLWYLDTRILSESYKNPIRIPSAEKSISSNAYTLQIRNCKGQTLNGACLWACLWYLDTRILSESYKNPIIIHNVENSISSNACTLPK